MLTNVTFKTDKDVKQKAQILFKSMGLDMSSAINIFLRQCLREEGLPFIPSLRVNPVTAQAIQDAENGVGVHGPFDTYEEMMKDITKTGD